MDFKQTETPSADVITLADAKLHCRVDSDITADDGLITALIAQATDYVERSTNQPLLTQTWTAFADSFSDEMSLKANLQSVTSVKYIDDAGILQTLAADVYEVDAQSLVGGIYKAYGEWWPSVRCQKHAVQIEFVCGFADPTEVPDSIVTLIKLLVGHWYANREAVIVGTSVSELPVAVEHLININKVWQF